MKTLIVLLFAACVLAWAHAEITVCTLEYAPVCAQAPDGTLRTFPNRCELEATEEQTHTDYTLLRSGGCFGEDLPLPPVPEEVV